MKVCPTCHEGSASSASRCIVCSSDLSNVPARMGTGLATMVIERRYRLDEFLHEGGMGWVYRGRHLRLDSEIAIKLMKPLTVDSGVLEARFEREARAASRLSSPHIISVFDLGRTSGGLLFIISELLHGTALSEIMRKQLPLQRIMRIFNQILAAVETAHLQWVVHRDLKPENIMVEDLSNNEDFVKVLDFGIAKLHQELAGSNLTTAGDLFGTPDYMAPELIDGVERAGPQSDLYSCAVILFEMLTGTVPFRGESVRETLTQHLFAEIPSVLSRSSVGTLHPDFDALLQRALAKKPSDRFQTAGDFRDELMRVADAAKSPITCNACHRQRHSSTALDATLIDITPAPQQVRRSSEPFVGREREQLRIAQFFDERVPVLEIIGSTGSGKTALLNQAATLAEARKMHLFRAGADPTLARRPWYAARQLVQQALKIPSVSLDPTAVCKGAARLGLNQERSEALLNLFWPGRNQPNGRPVDKSEILSKAIHSAVEVIFRYRSVEEAEICFLLDNAGEFDGASIQFVQYLCYTLAGSRSRAVIASDRGMTPLDIAVAQVHLGPLDDNQIRTLVTNVGGTDPTLLETQTRTLAKASRGNPFHVELALQLMARGETRISGTIEALIERRIDLLPQEALRLMQLVSVVGMSADLTLVELLGTSEIDMARAIAVLAEEGMAQIEDDRISFWHPAIRDVVHELMPSPKRRSLHQKALELLEQESAEAAVLARHAAEADMTERRIDLAERAGDIAHAVGDDESAGLVHYWGAQKAARWELLMGEEDERVLTLSLKLARSLRLAGHQLAAEMVLKEASTFDTQNRAFKDELEQELTLLRRASSGVDNQSAISADGF